MSYRRLVIVLVAGAGCANATAPQSGVDGGAADGTRPADAPAADPVDAPPGCTVMTRNLLVNEGFDMAPLGMGWTASPIDPAYPIITADGTLVKSAPNKAWLGGLAGDPADDELYQDVTVPATTTSLVLTGFYEVRTTELVSFPFDAASVELTTTGSSILKQVLALDNTDETTAWTPINHTFASPYAGQTVRLRLTSSNDPSRATSFLFDSLALTATSCE